MSSYQKTHEYYVQLIADVVERLVLKLCAIGFVDVNSKFVAEVMLVIVIEAMSMYRAPQYSQLFVHIDPHVK